MGAAKEVKEETRLDLRGGGREEEKEGTHLHSKNVVRVWNHTEPRLVTEGKPPGLDHLQRFDLDASWRPLDQASEIFHKRCSCNLFVNGLPAVLHHHLEQDQRVQRDVWILVHHSLFDRFDGILWCDVFLPDQVDASQVTVPISVQQSFPSHLVEKLVKRGHDVMPLAYVCAGVGVGVGVALFLSCSKTVLSFSWRRCSFSSTENGQGEKMKRTKEKGGEGTDKKYCVNGHVKSIGPGF